MNRLLLSIPGFDVSAMGYLLCIISLFRALIIPKLDINYAKLQRDDNNKNE